MRKLGRELGVEAMSLYHHFESKEALLDGMVETVVGSMNLTGMTQPGAWRERIKEGFRAYRRLAHDYPALFPLVGRRPVRTLAALRPVDVALGILREAGFSSRAGLSAFRTLSSFSYGFALSEIRGFAMESAAAGNAPPPEILQAESESFPNLAKAIPEAGKTDHDAEFEQGLDVIVTGLVTAYGLESSAPGPE